MSKRIPSRRAFLKGAGGTAMALPFLEALAPRYALGGTTQMPKRILVYFHMQGVSWDNWFPKGGSEYDWELKAMLQSLGKYKDRINLIGGLDNRHNLWANDSLAGHYAGLTSLLTCTDVYNENDWPIYGSGPSVEQVIAERIGGSTPFERLDLGIGTYGEWQVEWTESWVFHKDANQHISSLCDPRSTFDMLFSTADNPQDRKAEDQLRRRRVSVLDAVHGNFSHVRGKLGYEDKQRLDAHASLVRELEQRLSAGPIDCGNYPEPSWPSGYDYAWDDDFSAGAQIEMMCMAMACGLTNVGTIFHPDAQEITFDFLNGGSSLTSGYDDWHGMVHEGQDDPKTLQCLQWYTSNFEKILDTLDGLTDVDGDNMLDTTLVLWISEFAKGDEHQCLRLPVIVAGCTGGPLGRFLDFADNPDDWGWVDSPNDSNNSVYTTDNLMVSLLQAFGGNDEEFGLAHESILSGGLPGWWG